MKLTKSAMLSILVFLAACGGDGASKSVDAPPANARCTATPTQTITATPRAIAGTANVTCDAPADLDVEACVQSESGGTFTTLLCQTASKSATPTLTVTANVGCGLDRGRIYRTKINVSVGGIKLVTDGVSGTAPCP
ncbi:MAG TPA: hypothetical protein PLF40_04605 [Kofleriaceae bacterium]|nr:hypothetical protein [Kofleriaceae bacterium]